MSRKVKISASSLIAILFISLFSLFTPASSTYAYTGGSLNNSVMSIGNETNTNVSTTNLITDNNETTGFALEGNNLETNKYRASYIFSTPVSLSSYKLKSSSATIKMVIKNSAGVELFNNSTTLDTKSVYKKFPSQLDDVKSMYIETTNSSAVTIYEWDVFPTMHGYLLNMLPSLVNNVSNPSYLTDGDIYTTLNYSRFYSTGSTVEYTFNSPITVNSMYIFTDGLYYNYIYLDLYNAEGGKIKEIQFKSNGWTDIEPVDGVTSVIFRNIYGNGSPIFEVDLNGGSTLPLPSATPEPTSVATPQPTPTATPEIPSGDRAIMTVTLTTGIDEEFDLSMNEVNAFLIWYDSASGSARYGIDKHDNNKGPFSKRTEYVIHDKILTFEVSEYAATE